MEAVNAAESKKKQFKDQAAKQRDKIRGLKTVEPETGNMQAEQLQNEPMMNEEDARLEELMSQKKS